MIFFFFFFFFIKICISSHSSFLNYFISVSFATFKIQTILKHFKGTQLVLISFSYFGIHFSSFRKKKQKKKKKNSTTDCPFCFFLWSGKWKNKNYCWPFSSIQNKICASSVNTSMCKAKTSVCGKSHLKDWRCKEAYMYLLQEN